MRTKTEGRKCLSTFQNVRLSTPAGRNQNKNIISGIFCQHSLRSTLRQVAVYGIIGFCGTFCHYLILIITVELFNLNPSMASSLGFILGAIVNHEINRRILFKKTRRRHLNTAVRFLIIATLGFFINLGIVFTMLEWFDFYYLSAQIMATMTVFFLTFFINRSWTFQI